MNNAATINLPGGIILTYSRATDARVRSAILSGTEAQVTCRSAKAAQELAGEARAWGATAEAEGRDLKVA